MLKIPEEINKVKLYLKTNILELSCSIIDKYKLDIQYIQNLIIFLSNIFN